MGMGAACLGEILRMTLNQKIFLIILVVVLGYLISLLSPILTPFCIAALLAYLGDPIVNRMGRLGVPRTLAVTIVFILLFSLLTLLLVLLIPLLQEQIALLLNNIPSIITWIQEKAIPWLNQRFGLEATLNLQSLKIAITQYWTEMGNVVAMTWSALTRSGHTIFAWGLNLILIPVVTFYLLRDWDSVLEESRGLLPRRIEPTVMQLIGECDEVLSAFFRGQLLVMLAVGLFYAVGLRIVGLELAWLIGLSAGVLGIIPYLGSILGLLIAGIATLIQLHDPTYLWYVLIVFAIGHVLEAMWLTPLLVGDRIGLHPVAVIFAILAGGQLFGVVGILLALPVAAVIMVLIRHSKRRYLASTLYSHH